MRIRVLNRLDILALTRMKEINDLSARLFQDLSFGKLKVPQRIHLDSREDSTSLIMPAYSETEKLFSVKVVNLALGNPSRQLPLLHGLLLLADSETGIPFALMDAGIITAIRTGAAGGLAVRLFSHPDSEVLALIGAGIQSEWQLRAAIVERPIKKVLVFDTNPEKAEQFCHKLKQEFETDIIPAQAQSVLAEADIICTATTSATPVIHHYDLKPHVHINAIGSYKPDVQEIPEEIVRKSVIIVDQKEAAIHETGDLIIPIKKGIIRQEDVRYEIGELVGKETDTLKKSRTLFKSVGNAAQDLYVGYWIFQKAVQAGMGKEIEM